MTSEALKLYKLIILYFLSRSKQPMPNSIISDFILDNGYTDYFSIQQTLTDLTDDKMITSEQTHKTSYYSITPSGLETLEFFGKQLPSATQEQIDEYLRDNKVKIVETTTIRTDYTKLPSQEYLAKGEIIERGSIILEVGLSVPTEEEAIEVCRRFQDKNEELYSFVLRTLSTD